MDIGSGKAYPSNALSNFSPHPFVFDGVEVNSMEGLLQSFKFDKIHIQREVCKLVGFAAKRRGFARNRAWKSKQTLWWNGVEFPRDSDEYQKLLDGIYIEMAKQNQGFRNAIIASGDAVLTHSIGRSNIHETVLTEREFCSRLHMVRDMINSGRL